MSIPVRGNDIVQCISCGFVYLKERLTKSEMEKRLKKMLRYSNPDKTKKTLFVWPEGVFSAYSYYEILQFKEIFFWELNLKMHVNILSLFSRNLSIFLKSNF